MSTQIAIWSSRNITKNYPENSPTLALVCNSLQIPTLICLEFIMGLWQVTNSSFCNSIFTGEVPMTVDLSTLLMDKGKDKAFVVPFHRITLQYS